LSDADLLPLLLLLLVFMLVLLSSWYNAGLATDPASKGTNVQLLLLLLTPSVFVSCWLHACRLCCQAGTALVVQPTPLASTRCCCC
jgi:hypothetical protein